MVFASEKISKPQQQELIIGGGPTGLFSALKLLQAVPDCHVRIIEKRSSICRPQVVNAAFDAINSLPEAIKMKLWPDPLIYNSIFGNNSKIYPGFWPYTDYRNFTIFQIGEFQKAIKDYIEENYKNQFFFDIKDDFTVEDLEKIIKNYSLVLVTSGDCPLAINLRTHLDINDRITEQREEINTRGIYLIYESSCKETFERKGKPLNKTLLGMSGITYGHSNDLKNHVQLYSYPTGDLRKVFEHMPESFKQKASYPHSQVTFDGGLNLDEDEQRWFLTYTYTMKYIFQKFDIPHPADDKIKVFYATRGEYFYETAAARLQNVPIVFVGDSCGSTDYMFGLSLGRGLLAAKNLTDHMVNKRCIAFDGIVEFCNNYWSNVIASEFDQKNPKLTKTPEIVFKYFMNGRTVDGTTIKLRHKEKFIQEVNRIEGLTDKIKMFVNTNNPKAIKI